MERRIIGPENDPYMIRWIVLRARWFTIMVHKFMRSDYERALHDHPWPFITVILRNGYDEVTPRGMFRRRPGRAYYRPATWKHRVVLRDGKPAWTLILKGRRARRWGFWIDDKWCWWRKYNMDAGICEDRIMFTHNDD